MFVHRLCHAFLVLKSTVIFLWISPCTWPAPSIYVLIKDWLQEHFSPCSSTGSCSQRGPVFGLMLCHHSLKFLKISEQKTLEFSFFNGMQPIMSLVLLVPYILRLCWTHFLNHKLIGDDLLDFLDKPFHHLNEILLQPGSFGSEVLWLALLPPRWSHCWEFPPQVSFT